MNAVIFDLDGTLLDSVDLHARAWHETFLHFGIKTDFRKVRDQIGKGADQLLPEFLSAAERQRQGQPITEYREQIFERNYSSQVKPFPHVLELFERLTADRKKIAVGSSSKKDGLEKYLRLLKVEHLVQAAISADDADKSKPHPDIFAGALQKLNEKPVDVVAVGDTRHDAEAAGKAGLSMIGFLCGGVPESQLRAAGCKEIYRDPADLLAQYRLSILLAARTSG